MVLVHKHTSLAELDKGNDIYPEVICRHITAEDRVRYQVMSDLWCTIWNSGNLFSENFGYSCQYNFTNAPYFIVYLQMPESLNNTKKMDWACSARCKKYITFQLGDMEGKMKRKTWENKIIVEFSMIGICGLDQYRQSLAFVNTVSSLCCFEDVSCILTIWATVIFAKCHYCIPDLTYLRLYTGPPIV